MSGTRWAVLALCGAGLLRDVSVHVWKENPLRAYRERRRPDTRFEWIPRRVPADVTRMAFVSDAPPGSEEAARRLYDARYALCPRIVEVGLDTTYAVAEVTNPSALEPLLRDRAVLATRGTIALLARRP